MSGICCSKNVRATLLQLEDAMFDDLPDGCVAHVIALLYSVKDALNFAVTCTRHAEITKALRTKWLQLLHKDFDTRLQVQVSANTMTPHPAISRPVQ